jgi:Zinc carboxypeptidase
MSLKRASLFVCVLLLLNVITVSAAEATPRKVYGKMTYETAKARIQKRKPPDFWIGDVKDLPARFKKLKRGKVEVIAQSPGKRPMHLITYGEKEELESLANFNSAIGAREPSAYMDKAARKKPVIYLVGPVHGHEVEALTGLVNLINVMETGKDLRGRDQAELRELGDQCRLLIIPAGNPDGVARFEPRYAQGMTLEELRFWAQGTWSDNTLCGWPQSKRLHPMAGERVGFRGCYFNDAGINPMHDEFLGNPGAEAAAILCVAREEGPDLATSLHSYGSAPSLLRPAYVTMEVQEEARNVAKVYNSLLQERNLPGRKVFKAKPEGGKIPSPFNLTSAIYHVSGATVFTFECPHGITGEKYCQVNCSQILDMQLLLYEAMMKYELGNKAK